MDSNIVIKDALADKEEGYLTLASLINTGIRRCVLICTVGLNIRVDSDNDVKSDNLSELTGTMAFRAYHMSVGVRITPDLHTFRRLIRENIRGNRITNIEDVEIKEGSPAYAIPPAGPSDASGRTSMLVMVDDFNLAGNVARLFGDLAKHIDIVMSSIIRDNREDVTKLDKLNESAKQIVDRLNNRDMVICVNNPMMSLMGVNPARFTATKRPGLFVDYMRCCGIVSSCLPQCVICHADKINSMVATHLRSSGVTITKYRAYMDINGLISRSLTRPISEMIERTIKVIRSVFYQIAPESVILLIFAYLSALPAMLDRLV